MDAAAWYLQTVLPGIKIPGYYPPAVVEGMRNVFLQYMGLEMDLYEEFGILGNWIVLRQVLQEDAQREELDARSQLEIDGLSDQLGSMELGQKTTDMEEMKQLLRNVGLN